MGCCKKSLHQVWVVGDELSQAAPKITVPFVLEAGNKGNHGHDAVLPQPPNGLVILARGRAFADPPQRRPIGMVGSKQYPGESRLFIEAENLRIAYDVTGPDGA